MSAAALALAASLSSVPLPEPPAAPPATADPLDACLARFPLSEPDAEGADAAAARWRKVELPALDDDLSRESIAEAARRSADYWAERPDSGVTMAGRGVTGERLRRGFEELWSLAVSVPGQDELRKRIAARFDVYQSLPASGETGRVTGYFSPVFPVSAERAEPSVPIHAAPEDERLRKLTRRQIAAGALDRAGLELAWTRHAADLYTLQIEGSGWGVYPDGRRLFLSYAAHNDQAFGSVSTRLRDCGITETALGSLQLDAFLKSLEPARERKAVDLNPRYIFFRAAAEGAPTGALGVALTPGRSIAVDRRHVPLGLPGVLAARRTVAGPDGTVTGQRDFARLVVTHDVGSAIRGGARVDLYFGDGAQASAEANRQDFPGRLYVLLPK